MERGIWEKYNRKCMLQEGLKHGIEETCEVDYVQQNLKVLIFFHVLIETKR